jgi:hypothetical protein
MLTVFQRTGNSRVCTYRNMPTHCFTHQKVDLKVDRMSVGSAPIPAILALDVACRLQPRSTLRVRRLCSRKNPTIVDRSTKLTHDPKLERTLAKG